MSAPGRPKWPAIYWDTPLVPVDKEPGGDSVQFPPRQVVAGMRITPTEVEVFDTRPCRVCLEDDCEGGCIP